MKGGEPDDVWRRQGGTLDSQSINASQRTNEPRKRSSLSPSERGPRRPTGLRLGAQLQQVGKFGGRRVQRARLKKAQSSDDGLIRVNEHDEQGLLS